MTIELRNFLLTKIRALFRSRWWNKVFEFAQEYLGVPNGTTVLVETITASFN
jgi:malate synthase